MLGGEQRCLHVSGRPRGNAEQVRLLLPDHLAVIGVAAGHLVALARGLDLLRDHVGDGHQGEALDGRAGGGVRIRQPPKAVRPIPYLIIDRRAHPAAADEADFVGFRHPG